MARKTNKETSLAECDIVDLVELANDGSKEALDLVSKDFMEHPEHALIFGDLDKSAITTRINASFGSQPASCAAVEIKMKDIVKQVAGDDPTPLERLLAQRIAMCWLDLQQQEHKYSVLGNNTTTIYTWQSKMIDRSHNRYLSAIKALAKVKRMKLPSIQLNIADQQVNTLELIASQKIDKIETKEPAKIESQ